MAKKKQSKQVKGNKGGEQRLDPGMGGGGEYYRIILKDADEFETFRYHDVGEEGHIQRLAGKKPDGTWETQAWLISKEDAHAQDGELIPDSEEAQEIIEALHAKPIHIQADVFKVEGTSE